MFFVKEKSAEDHKVFYQAVDFRSTRIEKFEYLEKAGLASNIEWVEVQPNKKHIWLTDGLQTEFEDFLPIGSKDAKAGNGNAIFNTFSNGVKTNRDIWAYNFDHSTLIKNIQKTIEFFNFHVHKWARLPQKPKVLDFIDDDNSKKSVGAGT